MPSSPQKLRKLCVIYLNANHDLKDTQGKLVIPDFLILPLSVRELFFNLYRDEDRCLISYSLAMRLVGRDTRHLDMKGVEPFNTADFAIDLRQKGVHQLRSLMLAPWGDCPLSNRIQPRQLVPNESLVKLFMRQLHCATEDMATFAFKFPNLIEITVTVQGDCSFECLSKLEHLKEFHFYYGQHVLMDESDQSVADKLLYRLLRSVPNLTRAGKVSNGTGAWSKTRVVVDDMSGGLRLCRMSPLNLRFATLDTSVVGNTNLGLLLPRLSHLEMVVSSTSHVQNFLNFPLLRYLQIWPVIDSVPMDQFYASLVTRYESQAEIIFDDETVQLCSWEMHSN